MSHPLPMHFHERAITLALGPVTATIPDGTDDSSSATPTPAAPTPATTPSPDSSTSSSSKSSKSAKSTKSTKTSKDATTSETSVSLSSFPNLAAPSTTSSSSSVSSSTASIISTSTASTTFPAAATTSTAASSSHSSGTSPGLVAFAVIACLAFVGAIAWVLIMRRHHKQREWTFQEHQRIFERFDKSKNDDVRPNTSHTVNSSFHPPMPVAVVDNGKAWSDGTGASVITTGPSVVRNLDWDQGPERRPKSIIEAKPKRKPVPPPKEVKKKTFSQYLPYLLPQNHSAEVIELGKAQEQVYQKPIYKPAG